MHTALRTVFAVTMTACAISLAGPAQAIATFNGKTPQGIGVNGLFVNGFGSHGIGHGSSRSAAQDADGVLPTVQSVVLPNGRRIELPGASR